MTVHPSAMSSTHRAEAERATESRQEARRRVLNARAEKRIQRVAERDARRGAPVEVDPPSPAASKPSVQVDPPSKDETGPSGAPETVASSDQVADSNGESAEPEGDGSAKSTAKGKGNAK